MNLRLHENRLSKKPHISNGIGKNVACKRKKSILLKERERFVLTKLVSSPYRKY